MKVFNLDINVKSKEFLFERLLTNKFTLLVTCNAEIINKANNDERLSEIINNNFATIDGQIPYFIAKYVYGHGIEKISGSDVSYDLLKLSKDNNFKIFLLGADRINNEKAVDFAKREYGIRCYGYSPPFMKYPFPEEELEIIKNKIISTKPDIILVGFGAPKQEYWMSENKDLLKENGVKLVIGVGGTIDFWAGSEVRAPHFVQNIGLESIWRLFQRPERIIRLIKCFSFFKYVY